MTTVKHIRAILLVFAVFVFCAMCKRDPVIIPYKTKHVIIIVVDGPRYTETWGNGELTYIPKRAQMSLSGSLLTNCQNNGWTYTNAGHTAMTTGLHEQINNNGFQLPSYPSIFQYWRRATNAPQEKAWVISSKDKLFILADCADTNWTGQFSPRFDCGVNGPFTGYREDSVTFNRVMGVLQTWHPDMMLVNFKGPDAMGHANNWSGYLNSILETDEYVGEIWDFLQSDPYYAGETTLIVTNDHGRHLDGVQDGFVSHGDGCAGCRHVEFLGMGPDFKENYSTNHAYDQVDIAKTVSQLMLFPMNTGNGVMIQKIMK